MFTTGFAIFLAMVFIFIKLPRRAMLRLLRYDAALDIGVTLLVLVIHFGTFSGVMFGYIKGDQYFPGFIRLAV
jgi:hypothetical protein